MGKPLTPVEKFQLYNEALPDAFGLARDLCALLAEMVEQKVLPGEYENKARDIITKSTAKAIQIKAKIDRAAAKEVIH